MNRVRSSQVGDKFLHLRAVKIKVEPVSDVAESSMRSTEVVAVSTQS